MCGNANSYKLACKVGFLVEFSTLWILSSQVLLYSHHTFDEMVTVENLISTSKISLPACVKHVHGLHKKLLALCLMICHPIMLGSSL